jgi:hypothetical protein
MGMAYLKSICCKFIIVFNTMGMAHLKSICRKFIIVFNTMRMAHLKSICCKFMILSIKSLDTIKNRFFYIFCIEVLYRNIKQLCNKM